MFIERLAGYHGPQRLEDAIDWALVVRRYHKSIDGGDDVSDEEEEKNGILPNNKNHMDAYNDNSYNDG